MLKIFTQKHRGDLIVISLLFLVIIYAIISSFLQGYPSIDFYFIFMIISLVGVIGIIFVNSEIKEEPFLTTMQGVIVLILVILFIGGAYTINSMYGGIFSFFYMIGFVFLVLYINDKTTIFEAKHESEYVSREMESEVYRIPSDEPTRHIPSEVKRAVWARDKGRCVLCGSTRYIHYDHDIPFSKGGGNSEKNIRILCEKCNLKKSDKIE